MRLGLEQWIRAMNFATNNNNMIIKAHIFYTEIVSSEVIRMRKQVKLSGRILRKL
jgi:hypothetical protein